ncbi:hypothetical protein [Gemmatirosa kalamazoonensis]|nr:hypothetical protein [Gemmatirosa kalamazoonensis]
MSEQTVQPGEAPSCPKCGGAMWDNRESKRNPRAPDFKCRDKACDGVIWPPRDAVPAPAAATDTTYEPRQWPAPAGTPDDPACPVCGGKMWDDRTSKRNPRAPDFKCRNKPKVMGGPGCPGVIWPPREGESRAPAAAGARPAAPRPAARPAPPPPAHDAPPPSDNDYPGYDDEDLPF